MRSMESNASYPRLAAEEGERLKTPERDVRDLRQANEILGKVHDGGDRPPLEAMIAFIDEHRNAYGVEVICEAAQRSTVRFVPVEL